MWWIIVRNVGLLHDILYTLCNFINLSQVWRLSTHFQQTLADVLTGKCSAAVFVSVPWLSSVCLKAREIYQTPRYAAAHLRKWVSINCTWPHQNVTVEWYKAQKYNERKVEIKVGGRIQVLNLDGLSSLIITDVERHDSGVYYCRLNDVWGAGTGVYVGSKQFDNISFLHSHGDMTRYHDLHFFIVLLQGQLIMPRHSAGHRWRTLSSSSRACCWLCALVQHCYGKIKWWETGLKTSKLERTERGLSMTFNANVIWYVLWYVFKINKLLNHWKGNSCIFPNCLSLHRSRATFGCLCVLCGTSVQKLHFLVWPLGTGVPELPYSGPCTFRWCMAVATMTGQEPSAKHAG